MLGPIPSISYPLFIVSGYGGFEREPGPFVKLWAAICSVFGWRCPCPKCGGKMERALAPSEAYVRVGRTRSIGTNRRISDGLSTVIGKVQVTPVYDTCTQCGHRIRRRNSKLTIT